MSRREASLLDAKTVDLIADGTEGSSVASVDAHWRALCYLGLAQLICRRNALSPRALRLDDIKPRIVGHWGALPGVAYAVALSSARSPCRVILGTGHAAGVVRAELWLRGLFPALTVDNKGADSLCRTYGAPGGATTELDPTWPGIWWNGGELGPALAIASGAAVQSPVPIVAITGDGEFETGAASAGAVAIGDIAATRDVRLCWIMNLNGWRMGGRSRLASIDPSSLSHWLEALGWKTWIGCGDISLDLPTMTAALDSARNGQPSALILVTEKGWTGPTTLSGNAFQGASAHKLPLRGHEVDLSTFHELVVWLESYDPYSIFDSAGQPISHLSRALSRSSVFADLAELPSAVPSFLPPQLRKEGSLHSPMEGVVAALEGSCQPLLVTCPDELSSNRASRLARVPSIRIVDTLSEEVCAACLWGWTRSGRRGVFLTYEAFAPLVASQLAQYGKILAAENQRALPSLVVVLTSLGWDNTPSHANPDVTTMIASHRWPFSRAWFPLDDLDAAVIVSNAVASNGRIDLVTVSKTPFPRYCSVATPDGALSVLTSATAPTPKTRGPSIFAVGDLAIREACAAAELLLKAGEAVSVIAIRELTALGNPSERPHALSSTVFGDLLSDKGNILVTTTAAAAVASLLAERGAADKFAILGYSDGVSTSPLGTLLANRCDRWTIACAALEGRRDALAPLARTWQGDREAIWEQSIVDGDDGRLPPIGPWRVQPK